MPTPKIDSLNNKVILAFIILGLFLLSVLFILIVPKMQKEQKSYAINQIDSMISLTNQQLKFAVKTLINHIKIRQEKLDSILKYELSKVQYKLQENNISAKSLSSDTYQCNIYILDQNNNTILKTTKETLDQNIINQLIYNELIEIKNNNESVCPNGIKQLLYASKIKDTNNSVVVSYDLQNFNKKSVYFESKIKADMQKSFSLTKDIHKGKIYLMWIDVENAQNNTQALYQSSDQYFNKKYCISQMSNVKYPQTGLLTAKEILDAADKKPIMHFLDSAQNKGQFIYPALTWVRSVNDNPKRKLLFITSVYLKDIDNKLDSSFWKILPASLIALLFAIFFGYFLLRKLFKSITILTTTAKMVNEGNMTYRSGITEKDDIGILANTFDNMLDSIEKNINELDNQVEIKTKELRSSLEDRDTLLKEIHHRVKNNLAMTISLIKLQKSKLKDEETTSVLTDIQERVYTMELLHRKLYESKNLSSIDFKKYVIDLVDDLYITYGQDKNIKISIDIIDIFMNIEYALPCGLIINECVTNSFKYAFLENKGSLYISLKKEQDFYILKICDDGIGIPSEVDTYRSKTLGLRLINSIAKGQLLGELSYSNKELSMFEIRFNINHTA